MFGLVGLAAANGHHRVPTSLGSSSCCFSAAGIVLLALKPSNEWYRFRGWQRATGQG